MTQYPSGLDTNEILYVALNNKATTLTGPISAVNIDIPVTDASGLQANNGLVSIGNEVIQYSFIDTNVLRNCTRGFDGTSPASHSQGARVEVRWVAAHHNGLADAIVAIQSALGVDPHVSGTYGDVAERLDLNLPLVVPVALSNDWSFSHNRKRIVGIQLWRKNGSNLYEKFEAGIEQELNPTGAAQVNIILGPGNDEEGYIVVT